jgi:hypothetical protein
MYTRVIIAIAVSQVLPRKDPVEMVQSPPEACQGNWDSLNVDNPNVNEVLIYWLGKSAVPPLTFLSGSKNPTACPIATKASGLPSPKRLAFGASTSTNWQNNGTTPVLRNPQDPPQVAALQFANSLPIEGRWHESLPIETQPV